MPVSFQDLIDNQKKIRQLSEFGPADKSETSLQVQGETDLKFPREQTRFSLMDKEQPSKYTLLGGEKSEESKKDEKSGYGDIGKASIEAGAKLLENLYKGQSLREATDREAARQAQLEMGRQSQDIVARRGQGMQSSLGNMIAQLRSSMVRR